MKIFATTWTIKNTEVVTVGDNEVRLAKPSKELTTAVRALPALYRICEDASAHCICADKKICFGCRAKGLLDTMEKMTDGPER